MSKFYALLIILIALWYIPASQSIDCSDVGITFKMTQFPINQDSGSIFRTAEFAWIGEKSNDVLSFIKTNDGYQILKSIDGGLSWKDQMSKLEGVNDDVIGSDGLTRSGISKWYQFSSDKNQFILMGKQTRYWITRNAGETYSLKDFSDRFHSIVQMYFHKTNPKLIMMSAYDKTCNVVQTKACVRKLYVSQDSGESWSDSIQSEVSSAKWIGDTIYGMTSPESPFRKSEGCNRCSFVSRDFGKTVEILYGDSDAVQTGGGNNIIISKDGRSEPKMMIGDESGSIFRQVSFKSDLPNYGMKIIDTEGLTNLVAVNHLQTRPKNKKDISWSTLYVSDPSRDNYTLSLDRVVSVFNGDDQTIDFCPVKGTNGRHFANVMSPKGNGILDQSGIQTMITYNQGLSWRPLTINSGDRQAIKLNLLSKATSNSDLEEGPLSSRSVPGLILANGFEGVFLKSHYHNSYISTDGGYSWKIFKRRPSLYSFVDTGKIILMVDTDAANVIHYSLDQGETIKTCAIGASNISFKKISTHPSKNSQTFVLHGIVENEVEGATSHLATIEFTQMKNMRSRECTVGDGVGADNSDFEYWTLPGDCYNGRKIKSVRRKESSQCTVVTQDFDEVEGNICACTMDDYVCDDCYERVETPDGYKCQLKLNDKEDYSVCNKTNAGYKRRHTNQCIGGVNPRNGGGYSIVLLLIVAVILGLIVELTITAIKVIKYLIIGDSSDTTSNSRKDIEEIELERTQLFKNDTLGIEVTEFPLWSKEEDELA